MPRRGCWPRWGSAMTRWRGCSSRRMRRLSGGCWKRWTPPRWRPRWGRGWRPGCKPAACRLGLGGGSGGRWRWMARRCAAPGMPAATGQAQHLLAAADQQAGAVLAQAEVDGKTNEITCFVPLLAPLDLAGAVVTADALHAQREHAQFLVTQKNAHYILAVKNNQPTLYAQLASLPWRQVPAGFDARERGHGRAEWRTLKTTAVAAGIAFPHAAQAIQIKRRRKPLSGTKKWSTETSYAVTSLAAHQAAPAQLAGWMRGHWGIEALHHIRDVTYGEDASQIRTGNGPQVMATLRNLTIGVLKLGGYSISPPPAATTPATPPVSWPRSDSARHNQTDITPLCRGPAAFSRWRGRTRSLTLTSRRLLAEIWGQGHTGSMTLLVFRGWSLRGQHGGDQAVPLGGSTVGPHLG